MPPNSAHFDRSLRRRWRERRGGWGGCGCHDGWRDGWPGWYGHSCAALGGRDQERGGEGKNRGGDPRRAASGHAVGWWGDTGCGMGIDICLSQGGTKLFQLRGEDHAGGLGGAAIAARKDARVGIGTGRMDRDGHTGGVCGDGFSQFGEWFGIRCAFRALEGEPRPALSTCSARC